MLIFGWGKVTRRYLGGVYQKLCSYCNTNAMWQLCVMRTWFTLFFIPVIPYSSKYCIICPKCGSYIELSKEEFEKIKMSMKSTENASAVNDSIKYSGKTETQINFLKQMEEHNKGQ